MLDYLIKNATVVLPEGQAVTDVGVKDGRIEYVGACEGAQAERVIDATGKILLPGGIEAHAHIWEPMHKGWTEGRDEWLPDVQGTTRAALFGGTTTVASFAFMDVHATEVVYDVAAAVESRSAVFSGNSYAHYVFHPVLTGAPTAHTIGTIKEAIQAGTTTFKVFTTDVTSKQSGVRIESGPLLRVMETLAQNGGMLMVHAEDDELVRFMEATLKAEGRDQAYNLNLVHSALSEGIAFNKVLQLAKQAGSATFFAHVTSRAGLAQMRMAQRAGQPVYGEVLHNYLLFSNQDYHKAEGIRFHTYPAMKDPEDREALWQALADGTLSMVSTDEYTTSYATKVHGNTIETACGGLNGIETRGMVAYSYGYEKGRFSLNTFADVFSTGPARVLGLYPQKGAILPGSDADLVLWDPDIDGVLALSELHQPSDYSIFAGLPFKGRPVAVLLNGKMAVEDGKLLATPGDGRFVKRKMQEDMLRTQEVPL